MNTLENATILAIDDESLNLIMLEDFLTSRCHQLLLETDSEAGLVLVREQQPDVILLDILMGNIDGYEVCRRLKSDSETAEIPIIFLSSLARATDKVKGFDVGGVDYITKPFEFIEVIARLENCLKLHGQINQHRKLRTEEIASYQFTERELEVLCLYVSGKQRSEIAQLLFISDNTVKTYLQRLFVKLDVKNRTQAIEKAYKMGLI